MDDQKQAPPTLSPGPARGSDGPGNPAKATPDPSQRHAFDADQRASEREAAPITIGGQVFHRRRRNWSVTRELRRLLRTQERCELRARRAARRIVELREEAAEDELLSLEEEQDRLSDESDDAAYKIIAALLRDESGTSPDIEHIKDAMDVADAGELAGRLAGGGEPVADPTQTTTSPSS